MQNIKTTLKIFTISLGLFFALSSQVSAEVIKSFDAQIIVNTDASISVVETIVYDSEGLEKHGIFREIRPYAANGTKMKIRAITVVDENGVPYTWEKSFNTGNVELKIGDPNVTFRGQKTYNIRYTVIGAISYIDQYDEIYWNATGNNWPFAIKQATAAVVLPGTTKPIQQSCYVGATGDATPCAIGQSFTASNLNPGEGLTVAVGFPKGIVAVVKQSFWEKYTVQLIALGIPLLLFVFLFIRWRTYGRDPKGSRVIIPQYDVPDHLTPMEVALIITEHSKTKDISAELIYLATKGYVKITQTDAVVLGFIHNKGYDLTLLQDFETLEHAVDKELLKSIFTVSEVGKVVSTASLADVFYVHIPLLVTLLQKSMLAKQYYAHLPGVATPHIVRSFAQKYLMRWIIAVVIVGVLYLVTIVPLSLMNGVFTLNTGLIVCVSAVVSIGMILVFRRLMPAKTQKGVATKEYILGLKQYLEVAEKDRLQFHNAPEKKPELFERLLPYAMVLGVEKAWAKEFEGIYTAPPSWYQGTYQGGFTPLVLTSSLSDFSTRTTSSLGSTPSSSGSGSGGGGFSGGGGGGGGGGSW